MAVERRAPTTPAPVDFTDPKASLAFLLNQNTPLSEVDTAAAEAAIGMGGMLGSPFAANNMLRLRDSERINRLQIGQNLLQPYLNRESGERISNNQIAAQAASDAMRESGAMARLSAEGQQRLQLALIQGDQQAADRLLTESGLDRRSSAGIAAGLQEATMRNQASLLTSLLPFAYGNRGGGGSGGGGRGAGPTRYGTESGMANGPLGATYYGSPGTGIGAVQPGSSFEPLVNSGGTAPGGGGGAGAAGGNRLSGTLGPVLDRILAGYGLN